MGEQTKPLSKYTNKEWRGLIIAITFFWIFLIGLGVYESKIDIIKMGAIFIFIGILAGFVLHFFFGIKVIQLRKDFKHESKNKQ